MSFKDVLTELGGHWDESSGTCSQFGDALGEYEALCCRAAITDAGQRTVIELTGADNARYLHNFCTNDIKALGDGDGCEAFLTNVKGRILADVFVQRVGDSLIFDCDAGMSETLMPHLDRYIITEDVELHDRTSELHCLGVTPGDAKSILGTELEPRDRRCWNQQAICGDANFTLSLRMSGNHVFGLIMAPGSAVSEVMASLIDEGFQPAGQLAAEKFRIRNGLPRYGRDISDDNLAQEAGRTESAISFEKGCYLGQEPIARLDALGHVNRILRTIEFSTPVSLADGTEVFADGIESSVGTLSSCSRIDGDDAPVAMSMVKAKFAGIGQELHLKDVDGTQVGGAVAWNP